jgi:membrane protein implicated in regulation of membrane protease activity
MASQRWNPLAWLAGGPGAAGRDTRVAAVLACMLPLLLVALVNPLHAGNRGEFLAAMIVYTLPTLWAFRIDRHARRALEQEERLLRQVDEQGQALQTDLASGRASLTLDGETWRHFIRSAAPEQGVMQTSVRMVQSLCHEAASGRFPPIATLTQIYAAELRDGVRRLKVPQTLALRLGILGTFIGLLLALGHLGEMVHQAARDTLPVSEISPLVRSMMIAFGTSVAGLLSAILIQLLGEALTLRQQGLTKRIEDTIGRVVTVLSMTLAGSELLRNLDALGEHVERLRGGLSDHEHQVRTSTREAVNAVEHNARTLGDGARVLSAAHEDLARIVADHNTVMGRVHVALDGLAGLDGRLSQRVRAELDDRDEVSRRAAQSEMSTITQALAPVTQHLAAHAEASRASADRIAQTLAGLDKTISQLARSAAQLEAATGALGGSATARGATGGTAMAHPPGQRVLLGLLCVAVTTNLVFVGLLLSRAA